MNETKRVANFSERKTKSCNSTIIQSMFLKKKKKISRNNDFDGKIGMHLHLTIIFERKSKRRMKIMSISRDFLSNIRYKSKKKFIELIVCNVYVLQLQELEYFASNESMKGLCDPYKVQNKFVFNFNTLFQ